MLFLTVIIGVGWILNTYLWPDDFQYSRSFTSFMKDDTGFFELQGPVITSFNEALDAIVNHWLMVNGRLANAFMFLFAPLPYWVGKCVAAIAMALFCISLWKFFGKQSLSNNMLAIAVPIMIWTGLQWNDQMQSTDFQFNYIIPSLMMMYLLLKLFNIEKSRKISWFTWFVIVIFALWQEGFTIAMLCFFFVEWLYNRRPSIFIVCCILFLGIVSQLLSSTLMRISKSVLFPLYAQSWFMLFIKSWLSIVATGWWLIRRRRLSGPQRRLIDRFAYGFLFAWLGALCIFITMVPMQRFHWPNDVLAIGLLILIIRSYQNIKLRPRIAYFLIIIYALWGASLIYWQNRILRFNLLCAEQLQKGNYVVEDPENLYTPYIPFWLMSIPQFPYGSRLNDFQMFFTQHFTDNASKTYIVLQEDNIGKNIDEWPVIDGNMNVISPTEGLYMIRLNDSIPAYFSVTPGEATVGVTPLNYLFSKIGAGDTEKQEIMRLTYHPIVLDGKAYGVIYLDNAIPLRGRRIKSISAVE